VWNLIPPVVGFIICPALWVSLSKMAMIVGSIWMIAGITFGVWMTEWFREPLSFDVPAE
jgi:putrescine importer